MRAAAVTVILAALHLSIALKALLVPVSYGCGSRTGVILVPLGYPVVVVFTHSVHLSVEYDKLAVTPKGFYVTEVYAEDLGAGVPSSPSELGGGFSVPGPAVHYVDVWSYRGKVLVFDLYNAINMTVQLGSVKLFDSSACRQLVLAIP